MMKQYATAFCSLLHLTRALFINEKIIMKHKEIAT